MKCHEKLENMRIFLYNIKKIIIKNEDTRHQRISGYETGMDGSVVTGTHKLNSNMIINEESNTIYDF